jgi:hypothetical protein
VHPELMQTGPKKKKKKKKKKSLWKERFEENKGKKDREIYVMESFTLQTVQFTFLLQFDHKKKCWQDK